MVLSRTTPDDRAVAAVLARHEALMRSQTLAESCHVLAPEALATDDTQLFALRDGDGVVAVGALRMCGTWGELKSMHTVAEHRGAGHGRRVLRALLAEARNLGLTQLFLETGSGEEHKAARALYASEGFVTCGPFGSYSEDPMSVFMSRSL